jgi:hypothetical protein
MKIEKENGVIEYSFSDYKKPEIIIDFIKVYKQRIGTGRELINEVKKIALEKKLPISLYAYPQDDTISLEELIKFYFSCGFEIDNNSDGQIFYWRC